MEITPFDNEISVLYKWAQIFKIPVRLIMVSIEIEGDKEMAVHDSLTNIVNTKIQEGKNLIDIYYEIIDQYGQVNTNDVVMIYALLMMNRGTSDPVLDEINNLYRDINPETEDDEIENISDLRLMINDWREKLARDLESDMVKLENIRTIQNELAKYNEVLYSPLDIDTVVIKGQTTYHGNLPTTDDGVAIFDQSIPSQEVPYIKYNGVLGHNRQSLYKLYRGKTDDDMPNYNLIIPPLAQSDTIDTMYMSVWAGKDISKATRESYLKGSYSLADNLLTIKAPVNNPGDERLILDKIEQSIPIKVDDYVETSVSGVFYLFDLDINDTYLTNMILNHELLSTYLFIKENNTPYAVKKQIKIYYKSFTGDDDNTKKKENYISNPSSVSASLTQNYGQEGQLVTIQMPQGPTKFTLKENQPYVKIKITQAESKAIADRFIRILSRLMQYYKSQKDEVEQLFSQFIPELTQPMVISKIAPKAKRRATGSTIELLKDVAPDVFVKGYARVCQKGLQPVAINREEIPEWEAQTFIHKDFERNRQVMSYPPKNPKLYFVCPYEDAPFPGVKVNKTLENRDVYPYVPCCYKDDQMDPSANSNYNKYYHGKETKEEPSTTKGTHKVKTGKILGVNRFGFLPKSISDLISKYSPDSKDMVRIGVPRSPNSLIHCVSLALQYASYVNLSLEDKENYVNGVRKQIYETTLPNLVRQEMYDYSDSEISTMLSDNEIFLDPNLFYRAVENYYNINIYTFSPSDINKASFELPRFKLFHSGVPRPDRRVVLIYRTMGTEADALEYPQCELIVDKDEDNNTQIQNFGPDMNNLLHTSMNKLYKTITWDIIAEKGKPTQTVARDNIYSRINYFDLLHNLPTKQIIDGYGKARAFIFPIKDQEITVITPPTQPENLPSSDITRSDINIVVEIFGEPNSVTKTNNMTDGLWYQVLDIKHGIYIPVIPSNIYGDKEEGPANPLVEHGTNVVDRLRKIERDLEFIRQILIWLFIISKQSPSSFFNDHIIYSEEMMEVDSSQIYDFKDLPHNFPIVNNVSDGINQIGSMVPTLIKNDRIWLYSKKFYDGLLYYIELYDKELKPRDPKIPTIIYRSNISEEDFTSQPRVAVFTSERDMRTWLSSLDKLSFNNILIENKLNIKNALLTEPYLYTAPTGNIYMIQNVMTGDRLRAVNAAYYWYLYKINLGHRAEPFDTDKAQVPVNVVYGISPAMAPEIIENNAGESTSYLQILSYGIDQYAAMLPLL